MGLDQEELHDPMTAEDERRELLARRGQADTCIRLVVDEAGFGEHLDHGGGRAWNDAKRRCQLAHRHQMSFVLKSGLRLINGLEIVLNGA